MIKILDGNSKEINWTFNRFPDNQLQFVIDRQGAENARVMQISITGDDELILFFQSLQVLKMISKIEIKYFYGARSDKTMAGTNRVCCVADWFYQTITNYYSTGNSFIDILAPHCDDLLINRYIGDINEGLLKLDFDLPECLNLDDYDLLVFPDESAQRRVKTGDKESITCQKNRDQSTGEILSHFIPEIPEGTKRILVLDDLCDGGRTFKNIIMESGLGNAKVDLFVFHGVFSNNALKSILRYYDSVFVSNSLEAPEQQRSRLSADQDRVIIFNVW